MGKANIERGYKWSRAKAYAEFHNDSKGVEWMKSQKSIVDDMAEYDASLKPKETAKEKKARLAKEAKENR